jgi:hypothetical protein
VSSRYPHGRRRESCSPHRGTTNRDHGSHGGVA